MENETIAGIVFSIFLSGLVFGFLFIVYKTIVNGRKQKEYQKEMKVGNIVYVPVDGTTVEGVITAINGDDVEISTTFRKGRVYKK